MTTGVGLVLPLAHLAPAPVAGLPALACAVQVTHPLSATSDNFEKIKKV
jgi:hypothetical protein